MPVASNPNLPDFYVYVLHAEGQPFYVGVGRALRKERVRWVRSQIRRELKGEKGKWVCHTRVIRELLALGIWVDSRVYRKGLDNPAAHGHERKLIDRLKAEEICLANVQHNSKKAVADIVADVVRRVVIDRLKLRPSN
jgi:hypothetical protein